MSLKIISYDLRGNSKDYQGLISAIKEEMNWWHYLESFWMLDTTKSVQELTDKLIQFLDEDDRLIIIDTNTNNYNGFMPQKAFDWIDKRIVKKEKK